VPGWAYKDGRAYMELPAHDLTTSASLPVQQQFYQVGACICTPSCVLLYTSHLILDLFLLLLAVVGFPRFTSSSVLKLILSCFILACL
jgi:hypothetical protein